MSDWQLKLRRAQAHFDSLRESIEGFVNSDLYSIEVTEAEPGGEENTWVSRLLLRIREQPPADDWALMIGDIVHNTRSALDIMAYQHASDPDRQTAFPIHVTEPDFKGTGLSKMQKLPKKYRTLIEREQPYNQWKDDPPSDPLAILADLDNTSKHRVIPTVVSWFGPDALSVARLEDVGEVRLALTGLHPPEDGAQLGLIIFVKTGPNPKVQMDARKTVDVMFGEGAKRAVEKPVYETLVAIGTRISALISDFEKESRKP